MGGVGGGQRGRGQEGRAAMASAAARRASAPACGIAITSRAEPGHLAARRQVTILNAHIGHAMGMSIHSLFEDVALDPACVCTCSSRVVLCSVAEYPVAMSRLVVRRAQS